MVALSLAFMFLGALFFFATVVGVLRFPDVYTRMHAAGKGDTLSSLLVLIGFVFYVLRDVQTLDFVTLTVVVKLVLILLFVYIGSPTATHALARAAYKMKLPHWESPARKAAKRSDDQ